MKRKNICLTAFHPLFNEVLSGGEERIFSLSKILSNFYNVYILSVGLTNRLDVVKHGSVCEIRMPNGLANKTYNRLTSDGFEGHLSHASAFDLFFDCFPTDIIDKHIGKVDCFLHQYSCALPLLKYFPRSKHVYNSQNFDFLSLSKIHNKDITKEKIFRLNALTQEIEMMKKCDLVTGCSQDDLTIFRNSGEVQFGQFNIHLHAEP